jgi:hypothetical protein
MEGLNAAHLSPSQGLYPSIAWLVAGAIHQWLQLGLVPGVAPQPADAGVVTGLVVYKRFWVDEPCGSGGVG